MYLVSRRALCRRLPQREIHGAAVRALVEPYIRVDAQSAAAVLVDVGICVYLAQQGEQPRDAHRGAWTRRGHVILGAWGPSQFPATMKLVRQVLADQVSDEA